MAPRLPLRVPGGEGRAERGHRGRVHAAVPQGGKLQVLGILIQVRKREIRPRMRDCDLLNQQS